jgi:hypothetical protein
MKDCRGKERGDGQRLRLSLRRTKRLVRSQRGAPHRQGEGKGKEVVEEKRGEEEEWASPGRHTGDEKGKVQGRGRSRMRSRNQLSSTTAKTK